MKIWRVEMDFEDWHGIDARHFLSKEDAEEFVRVIKKIEPSGRQFAGMYEVMDTVVTDVRQELRNMEVMYCEECNTYHCIMNYGYHYDDLCNSCGERRNE